MEPQLTLATDRATALVHAQLARRSADLCACALTRADDARDQGRDSDATRSTSTAIRHAREARGHSDVCSALVTKWPNSPAIQGHHTRANDHARKAEDWCRAAQFPEEGR